MAQRSILVVDDEPAARYALTRVFAESFEVLEAESVAQARERLGALRCCDVVLLDHNMPGEDGLALLKEIGATHAVVMITAHGSERLAVEAMKAGAYDYLTKPFDVDEVRLVVARAIERQDLRREVAGLRERLAGEGDFGAMVGRSVAMREL
ncbi:MAG: response regulator, partial [Bryobacteraceae bacterium]